MKTPLWLPASLALQLLDVRPQTLYANVSRGRIRMKPDAADSRRSLYHRGDVERLAARSHGRRSSKVIAGEAIRWGEPILASSVSTIAEGRLWYRGQDACRLADDRTLEDIAALLWECAAQPFVADSRKTGRGEKPVQRAMLALAGRASSDAPSRGRSRAALHSEAAAIIGSLANALLGAAPAAPMHLRLAAAWRRPKCAHLLRRALVLLADHELNVSTFAARVTASTGASLAACLLSGLSTLTGPLHGGAAASVRALVQSDDGRGSDALIREWLAHDRPIHGFGHPLYPDGDARCAALLGRFAMPAAYAEFRAAGERLIGEPPNIDFALAAMAAAYGLPDDAPLVLFALARSVGWIAHALEQLGTGALIRPRARYSGPPLSGSIGSAAAAGKRRPARSGP